MNHLDEITRAADERDAEAGYTEIEYANLGYGDGNGTLIVTGGLPRQIWLHRVTTTERIIAVLPPNGIVPLRDGDADIEHIVVRIGKPPGIRNFKVVIDILTNEGLTAAGSLTPMEAFLYEAWWAKLNQIQPLRGRVTDPVSKSVAVDGPIWYIKPSTNTRQYISTLTIDLTAIIAALSSGQHQLGMLYLDKEAGTLNIATLTAVTAAGSLPSRSEFTQADVQASPWRIMPLRGT
jgi:hypothetical protein